MAYDLSLKCRARLYKTKIRPDRNAIVDDIAYYLNSIILHKDVELQYIKPGLEIELKLDVPQDDLNSLWYNYLRLEYYKNDTVYSTYYYFIKAKKWISMNCVSYELIMDTLNTYQSEIRSCINSKTKIYRQHKDRFLKPSNSGDIVYQSKLIRKVDKTLEDIGSVETYLDTKTSISGDTRWFLVYASTTNLQSGTGTELLCIPELSKSFKKQDGTSVTLAGFKDTKVIDQKAPTIMKIIECPYGPIFGTNSKDEQPSGWSIITTTVSSSKPYGQSNLNVLKFDDTSVYNKSFERTTLNTQVINDGLYEVPKNVVNDSVARSPRNILAESKLFNSNFSNYKFVYDSFSREIRLEDFEFNRFYYYYVNDTNTNPYKFNISYLQSTNVSSKLLFRFVTPNDEYLSNYYKYKLKEDFEEYLVSDRNNESMIYTNEYINYVRNGYNFDKKSRALEGQRNAINLGIDTAVQAGDMIGSIASQNYVAAAKEFASMAKNITNSIYNEKLKENSFQKKIAELQAQSASVSGADDLSLFEEYGANKLYFMTYKPSDVMQQKLFDLFYYTGYSDNTTAKPNFDTRRNFNYIQCDPQFDDYSESLSDFGLYLDDIKLRFNSGVTIYHKCKFDLNEYDYDWKQYYENWETWIRNADQTN